METVVCFLQGTKSIFDNAVARKIRSQKTCCFVMVAGLLKE
jgi:hypothetical protein